MSDDDRHVDICTSLLLRMVMMMMAVMRMIAERFLQLLMLAAYRNAVDVNRYRHDKTRRFPAVAGRRRPASAGLVAGTPADRSRQQRAATAALHHAGLDSLPLGTPVLEPYLDLDLAEAQLTRDHRPLGQGQVLLAVELLLQLEQLVASERRPSSPMSAARTRGPGGREGRRRLGRVVRRVARRRAVHVDDAVGPALDV